MKFIIIFSALFAVALSRPQEIENSATARTLNYDSNNIGVEGYNYNFDTSNSISASEQGVVNNVGTEDEALSVQGKYKYTGPDGVNYEVTYIADANGFQPQGSHLP